VIPTHVDIAERRPAVVCFRAKLDLVLGTAHCSFRLPLVKVQLIEIPEGRVGRSSRLVQYEGNPQRGPQRAEVTSLPTKKCCEKRHSFEWIPVFTLIRTDTTLDLSQKAEKV